MAMNLFISYRRSDSTHAAARVRMSLQQKFGADAVFIDREIPAGRPWEQYLEEMLEQSTGVVVLVGDEFLRLLRKGRLRADDAPDPLVWEIATAIRLHKPIYPVLFGAIDMPDASKLPEDIRALAGHQAVFAREPAFDASMQVLIDAIAQDHHWVEPGPPRVGETGVVAASASATKWVPAAAAAVLLSALALWWAGRVILWLADAASAPGRPAESAFWHGSRYVLATLLWGLGPYLAYWMVAELRARARLPIFNLHGMLSVVNVCGFLVSGGTFLLLSTLPGWRLQPLWIFPPQPGPGHYAGLAAGLLGMAVAAVAVAVWEPRVRALHASARSWRMQLIHGTSLALVACGLWFAASLIGSLPHLGTMDPVPVVGFLALCPALSLAIAGWQYGRSHSATHAVSWQIQALFLLVLGLYLACTLALFAYGPTRLLAPGL